MCGLSGSGKTSWIANNLKGFEVISLDQIRAELNGKRECQKKRGQVLQLAKLRLKRALAAKRNVVWDATNIRKDFRSVLCDLGDNYNALVTIVAFQQKLSRIYENNNKRRHAISYEVLEAQQKKLEWPWRSEAHRMLVIGEKGQDLLRQGTFL
ncbi:ATP-binding protein [Vibrio agarivorans]|nr:ATP-binding protein [Vibrio agarivorans]